MPRLCLRLQAFRGSGRRLHAGHDAAAEDRQTRTFGGEFITIKLTGDIFDQCYAAARTHVEETGAIMVPPFDDADIIEGQATVAAEMMDQLPDGAIPDLVIMPVGGGGLAAGITGYLADVMGPSRFLFTEPVARRA